MPASTHPRRSASMALAVRPRIAPAPAGGGGGGLRRVASVPSITGILHVHQHQVEPPPPPASHRLGAVLCERHLVAVAAEHGAEQLAVHAHVLGDEDPQRRQRARVEGRPRGRGRPARSPISSGTSNQNRLPAPGALSTPMAPPIASTSRLQIASPRPVPPYRRVVDASAWLNGSNSAACRSGGMPMPVSRTSKRSTRAVRPRRWRAATRDPATPPSVNLSALPSRLNSTCRSRVGRRRPSAGALVELEREVETPLGGLRRHQRARARRARIPARNRSAPARADPPRSARSRGCR